jgi:hypothetical protein
MPKKEVLAGSSGCSSLLPVFIYPRSDLPTYYVEQVHVTLGQRKYPKPTCLSCKNVYPHSCPTMHFTFSPSYIVHCLFRTIYMTSPVDWYHDFLDSSIDPWNIRLLHCERSIASCTSQPLTISQLFSEVHEVACVG